VKVNINEQQLENFQITALFTASMFWKGAQELPFLDHF